MKLKVFILNVRTLRDKDKLEKLENSLEKSSNNILGLAEIRQEGEKIINTKKMQPILLYENYSGSKGSWFFD